ncbi:MAG TPA: DUF3857 domain-containing protein [Proteobacteria bacterium]|nr:DUF3857 domain-containing protein [Pseudomonadota bacterium]
MAPQAAIAATAEKPVTKREAMQRIQLMTTFTVLIMVMGGLFAPNFIPAQELDPPCEKTFPTHEPAKLLNAVTNAAYPHDHAVLAEEIEHLEFFADGSSLGSDEVYLTILDEEGKRNHEVLSFHINRAYGDLEIELCEVLSGNRRQTIEIAAHSREEAAVVNSRANIYNPLQKTLKLFIPGLKIGDTIHYRLRRRQFKPIIEQQIYGLILGQYDIPIRSYHLTVTTPAETTLHWLIKDEVEGCVSFRQTQLPGTRPQTIHAWHFTDVPRIFPEPQMPSFRRVAMRLLFSTIKDWTQIAQWYADLVSPRLEAQGELKKMVAELTQGQSREAQVAALFYFVARQIRYLGVGGETERPGFEPHDVNLTFSRRHGVCRDKAALLVSMLRSAGFAADPVLIRLGDRLDTEIPLPYFNHAIVALFDENGKTPILLDPTSETSRQFLPDYERECSYLIARRDGDGLSETPPPDPDENRFVIRIVDQLDADRRLSGKVTVSAGGFNDSMLRSIMMNCGRQEQEDFLKGFFLSQYSGLELRDLQWSDPGDQSRDFTFSGNFSLAEAATENQVTPLVLMENPGFLERRLWRRVNLSERRYPLKLGYTLTTILEEELTLPAGSRGETVLPPTQIIDNQALYFSLEGRESQPGKISWRRVFAFKKTEIEPAAYPLLTAFQNHNRKLSLTPIDLGKP